MKYYPVMNFPVSSSITLLSDPPFKAKLREDIVDGDPDSILRDEVPVFHGLSVSGDVTGKYIYVGYGQKKDFDLLVAKGDELVQDSRSSVLTGINAQASISQAKLRS